jgi:hypothetical protein
MVTLDLVNGVRVLSWIRQNQAPVMEKDEPLRDTGTQTANDDGPRAGMAETDDISAEEWGCDYQT